MKNIFNYLFQTDNQKITNKHFFSPKTSLFNKNRCQTSSCVSPSHTNNMRARIVELYTEYVICSHEVK